MNNDAIPDTEGRNCCHAFFLRIKSLKYAYNGFCILIKEDSIRALLIHNVLLLMFSCPFLCMPMIHYMLIFLAMTLSLCFEAVNSSIELIADFVQPEYDEKIAQIKDTAAFVAFNGGIGNIIFIYALLIYSITKGYYWPYLTN